MPYFEGECCESVFQTLFLSNRQPDNVDWEYILHLCYRCVFFVGTARTMRSKPVFGLFENR